MRTARIKERETAFYHVIAKCIDGQHLLDEEEKERARRLMRRVEGFSGTQILTYTILDSHLHILLHVPERREVDDSELIRRLRCLYPRTEVNSLALHLRTLREEGRHDAAERFKRKYTYRMYDLSEFMKTFNQRCTQSYNARHGRRGTLWIDRFKSLLVEPPRRNGGLSALAAIAAYIDLNAVRAGLVRDPCAYRFCGYAEAVAGQPSARLGLVLALRGLGRADGWREFGSAYRQLLYAQGERRAGSDGRPAKAGFSLEQVQRVLDAGGKLTVAQLLHCRVRHFTDGLVLGSRTFTEDVSRRLRAQTNTKRMREPHRLDYLRAVDLCTLRRPRTPVVALCFGS